VFLIAVCLFFVAEVAAFVAVGEHIGFGWTVLLLIGVSALGPLLVRRVGLGALARTQARLAAGDLPTREVLDGVVALAGGLLVCLPGFLTDAAGLLLLVGPVRHLLIYLGGRRVARHVQTMRPVRGGIIDVRTWSTSDGAPTTTPAPRTIEPDGHPGKALT
jgi:UPF0716 protein FxsA